MSFLVHVSDPKQKLSDVATILIHVPENKQHGPKLSSSSCNEVWARENEPISRLTRIIASVNQRESTELHYQIEGGSGVDSFSINSTTGVISAKSLDREKIEQHILVVSASDNSVPRKVDVCTIKVKVIDLNDNAPEFTEKSPTYLQINDDQQIGMVIAKFEATDRDEGPNSRINYKLSIDESGIFDINSESGELFLARDLPILGNQWEIVIVAEDSGLQKVLRAERHVRIQWDRRSKLSKLNKLEFLRENQTVVLAEGQPRGKFVLQLETTAKFMNNEKMDYEILSGNINDSFELDEMGVLKTAKELDAEAESRYELKIQATMNGNRKAIGFLVIRLLNVNDNAPSFFPHVLYRRIEEDIPVGSLITTIFARDSDIDTSSRVEYSLTVPSEYFELQRATGDLFLLKSLDFETTPEHLLSVQAFDGEYSTFSTVKIDLIDINDNSPTFTTDLFEFSAPSSLRLPAEIGQATAIDADTEEFSRLEYSLIDSDGSLKINSNTGIVTLIRSLKENEEKFVTVKTSDHGTPPLTSISTIKISSVPKLAKDVPQFENQNYSFIVSEDFPLHLSFGQLSIKNGTSPIACRFQIEDAETSKQFEIDFNGQISIRKTLDFEVHQIFKTRVSVRNYFATAVNVASTHVALLTIKIVDVNDNEPKFTKESREIIVRVNEQTRRGSRLATMEASDIDSSESNHLIYSILPVGDNLIQNSFKIHASTGILHFERFQDEMLIGALAGKSANLTKLERKLLIMVEDTSGKWDIAEIRVEFDLESWSGTAPFFPLPIYKKFVLETIPIGTILLKARATNKIGIESTEWTYGMVNNDEIFKINSKSGEVVLNGKLDYEKRSDYEFNLTVTDQRQRSAISSVFISVIGVDEYAPVFSRPAYTFKVPWSAKPGQQIGRVLATDLDHGIDGRITYAIATLANKTRPSTLIGIDPQTGILLLRSSLKSQKTNQTDSVELEIVASSSPTQFSRASVYIEFSDDAIALVNDFSHESANSSRLTRLFLAGLIISLGLISVVFLWICLRFCTLSRQRRRKPRKQIYSVARGNIAVKTNVERLSPTYANYVGQTTSRFSSPTTLAANSLLSSSPSNEETEPRRMPDSVRIRNTEKNRMVMTRSQPDSGIDIDALSIGSLSEYLNQISARSASKFGDSVNAEIMNTSATQDSLRTSSHASSGIYDFPMRPTIRPLQFKKNLSSSYVSTTHTFTDSS